MSGAIDKQVADDFSKFLFVSQIGAVFHIELVLLGAASNADHRAS